MVVKVDYVLNYEYGLAVDALTDYMVRTTDFYAAKKSGRKFDRRRQCMRAAYKRAWKESAPLRDAAQCDGYIDQVVDELVLQSESDAADMAEQGITRCDERYRDFARVIVREHLRAYARWYGVEDKLPEEASKEHD